MIARYRPPYTLINIIRSIGLRTSLESLEASFAQYLGWNHVLIFPYARSAAYSLFKLLVGSQGKIVLPAYTCRSMLGAILASDNQPVFVDSYPDNFLANTAQIEKEIDSQTRLVVATLMYGSELDFPRYRTLTEKLPVLADCSLAFGNKSQVSKAGLTAAIYSLGSGKQFSLLKAGLFCTHDAKIHAEMQHLRKQFFFDHQRSFLSSLCSLIVHSLAFQPFPYQLLRYLSEETTILNRSKGLTIGVDSTLPKDWSLMPSQVQLDLGSQLLLHISEISERQRAIIARYDDSFRSANLRRFSLLPAWSEYSHYAILSDEALDLRNYLMSNGIHATNIFRELPCGLPLAKSYLPMEGVPNAQALAARCLLIPLNSRLQNDEVQLIITKILEWDSK
jgi:dTDP-4-amino-4,6-dideoxygalactose transaminase